MLVAARLAGLYPYTGRVERSDILLDQTLVDTGPKVRGGGECIELVCDGLAIIDKDDNVQVVEAG